MAEIDDGYFPRGRSLLREVHENRIVGATYGQRTLLIGGLFPMILKGTMLNSTLYSTDAPMARAAHTGWTMEQIWFGTRTQADRELERLYRYHQTVKWSTDQPLGSYPPGDYEALMPELLLGVLMCTADSGQSMYEACVRRLDEEEREALWQDYLLMGELFGLPRSEAPATYADYRSHLDAHLASHDAFVLPEAREEVNTRGYDLALLRQVPTLAAPVRDVINLLVAGTLPERVRETHGLPWGRTYQVAFDTLTASLRLAAHAAPAVVRRGSMTALYDVFVNEERRRLRRESPSAQAPVDSQRCPVG